MAYAQSQTISRGATPRVQFRHPVTTFNGLTGTVSSVSTNSGGLNTGPQPHQCADIESKFRLNFIIDSPKASLQYELGSLIGQQPNFSESTQCITPEVARERDLMLGLSANRMESTHAKTPSLDEKKYKTQLCRNWLHSGCCIFADSCVYAHGCHEIRPSSKSALVAPLMATMMSQRGSSFGQLHADPFAQRSFDGHYCEGRPPDAVDASLRKRLDEVDPRTAMSALSGLPATRMELRFGDDARRVPMCTSPVAHNSAGVRRPQETEGHDVSLSSVVGQLLIRIKHIEEETDAVKQTVGHLLRTVKGLTAEENCLLTDGNASLANSAF